uniref:NUDIX domain-containing protein n=1 Tax=Flavobacterium sp. TaxID=239 RepID=UPI00404A2DF1
MIPEIKILNRESLSKKRFSLERITYSFENETTKEVHARECFDRGDGAAILLYQPNEKKVVLTKQFRLPTFLNGNQTGQMIEVCAGMLDKDDPETCIIREVEEETGYRIEKVQKIFEAFMSPGAVTEILYFFIGTYKSEQKVSEGGGLADEQEHIEVLELDFETAYGMIASGEIMDAKTIMLLQYLKINSDLWI